MLCFDIYELRVKVYLKNKVDFKYGLCEVRDFIDTALLKNEKFAEFHRCNPYMKSSKYVFDKLYPFDLNSKIYKEGEIYHFTIRTSNLELAEYLLNTLEDVSTTNLKGLDVNLKKLNTNRIIEKVYSLTPVIITTKNKKYWRNTEPITFFEDRLMSNSERKLKAQNSEKRLKDFYSYIEFKNEVPSKAILKRINGKDIMALGDKVTLYINNDSDSQEMAWKLIADGLLEKNSRGCGFLGFSCY